MSAMSALTAALCVFIIARETSLPMGVFFTALLFLSLWREEKDSK